MNVSEDTKPPEAILLVRGFDDFSSVIVEEDPERTILEGPKYSD